MCYLILLTTSSIEIEIEFLTLNFPPLSSTQAVRLTPETAKIVYAIQ